MKKFPFTALLIFIYFATLAQYDMNIPHEYPCKHAGNFKNASMLAADIDQTILLWNYDVKFYFLDIEMENNTTFISGNMTIQAASIVESLDIFAFELVDELMINEVLINGIACPFSRSNHEVFAAVDPPVANDESFTVQIFYEGTPDTDGFFSGISTAEDWDKNVTWTLSEPFNARQWFPVKQVLEDKADSSWVFITTSAQNMAGSNGILTAITPVGNDRLRYEWKSGYPIAYYLISAAVSEYQEYNIYAHPASLRGDSILIQNFIYDSEGCLETYKSEIDRTAEFVEFFSDKYGLYPFYKEKYGHCLTAMGGGMEHQTMTTLGNFSFSLTSHELGHMWFGDLITCASWSDIWINEGFATYSDYLAHEFIAGDEWPKIWMNNAHNIVLAEPHGSIYIPPEEIYYENVSRIFNHRLSYRKGALLLHMIRFELQDDALFFTVLQNFVTQYTHKTATGDDFLFVLNTTIGQNFNNFFDQWYYGEGYPVFDLNWIQQENTLIVYSRQWGSCPESPEVFSMHFPLKVFFSNGEEETYILYQEHNYEKFMISTDIAVDSIQLDPEKHVLKKVNSIQYGLEDSNESLFFFSPNPATDIIRISLLNEPGSAEIFIVDTSGKIVFKANMSQTDSQFNIETLPTGVYLLHVQNNGQRSVKKFVKY